MKTNKSKKEQIKLNMEKIGVILPSIIMRDLSNIIM